MRNSATRIRLTGGLTAAALTLLLSATGGASRAAVAKPTITAISVNSVTTPSAAFTFTVTGTNFVQAAKRQPGTEVVSEEYGFFSSTVNSTTQITVNVPAVPDVKKAIVLELYVVTPGQGRSPKSTDIAFTINPAVQGPPPTLVSLSETSVTTPSAALTVTAAGTNFIAATATEPFSTQLISAEWGPLPTSVTSSTQLTFTIPALPLVKKAIVLHLFVVNPDDTQSAKTAELTFTINPPTLGPPPTLVSLSETSVTTPTAAFTITATGTNFVASSATEPLHTRVVSVEEGPLSTTVNSPTQLTINLPAIQAVRKALVLHLYVVNPDGTKSPATAELTFTINPPLAGPPPTITASSVATVTPPARNVSFTVTGTGFVSGRGERNSTAVFSEEYGELETVVNSSTGLTVYLGSIRKVNTAIVLHLYVQNPDGTRSASTSDIAFTIE